MSARTWTVDVDGVEHTILVDFDPKSRRAPIRVDGKLTAKPMAADDTEREIRIGDVRYIVRRLENDDFTLDISPEVFLNKATKRRVSESTRGRPGIGVWIGVVVALVIVAALVRFGMRGLQYMRVPWQPYASADGAFKAKFPATPSERQETQNINGDLWTFHSLQSDYKNHFFAVEYADLKLVVVEANAQAWLDRFLSGMATSVGGSVVSREKTSRARNPAVEFEVMVPASTEIGGQKLPVAARVRGLMVIRGNRMFVATTVAAAADPFSRDQREFIEAFEIAPPPPPPSSQVVEQQRSKADLAPPGRTLADVEKEARAEEEAAARRAAETAARRAAQPQIYLEAGMNMYHVAGCPAVTSQTKKVSMEERPPAYVAHLCVPEELQTWRRTK
jgi:hypothetical protein